MQEKQMQLFNNPTQPRKLLNNLYLLPQTGIEPVREYKSRRILSPVRLPVPPLRHIATYEKSQMGPIGLEPMTLCL